jgi:hypothetical protein
MAGRFLGLCFFLIGGLIPLVSCDLDKEEGILMAAGSYGDIAVVVSDDSLIPPVQPFLDRLNAPVTFVITQENPYNIDVFGPSKWKLCKGYRNILFLLRWGDGGAVEKKVNSFLSSESLAKLKRGTGGLAQVNDPFARYQFALLVGAHDRNSLASVLSRNLDRIRNLIEKKCTERIQRRFRHTGLREELMTAYWDRYQFFLEIPREYPEKQHSPRGFPGIEWESQEAARALTLAWRQSTDPESDLRDPDLLFSWRRDIGTSLQELEISDVAFAWAETTLAEIPCVKLTGSWGSKVVSGGGPFRSFFLSDPSGGRLVCLDLRCFAPGKEKTPAFREMQAIAETFSLQRPQP